MKPYQTHGFRWSNVPIVRLTLHVSSSFFGASDVTEMVVQFMVNTIKKAFFKMFFFVMFFNGKTSGRPGHES
jgi:hypothetical protein